MVKTPRGGSGYEEEKQGKTKWAWGEGLRGTLELGQGLEGMLEPLGGEQPRPVSCPSAPRAQRRRSCVARTAAGPGTPEDRNVGLCLFLF